MTIGKVNNPGEVKVTGFGEITSEPDCCKVEILVSSIKPTCTAAEESARKRAEYARQEINNRYLKCSITEHFDVVPGDSCVNAVYRFDITTCDISGIKSLLGYLKSKLQTYVKLGTVEFFYSKRKLFELRKEAVAQAVSDAKHKAELIASAFGQKIQGLVNVIENECDFNDGQLQVSTPSSNGLDDHYHLKQTRSKNITDNGAIFEAGQLYNRPFNWNESLRNAQKRIRIKLHVVCALSDFTG
ncbi:Interleukin-1 receptor-associated kinase 1-binding protein [Schistosoma japonicum]|uniref:Interleukin-1 receptor-associated kinase 1-binding protein n=2 Tax=Schistosoma japonicum TaxID=6182 RepID=C1LF07_SCHJA|nr:Interleukin-1 receptor-associated kinase 1-binding protein [Schistosoma japonicum]KAH8874092.1 Interleukin-1 receptor-associated kinase 1-binding protein [Schistosoma japonicum]TNN11616.1 Interleukin-1 receptor-associated kinase 1-binding protein [Schistosoma japonicum]CAX73285.1 hypothetical protein [Schistosoma japonicum]